MFQVESAEAKDNVESIYDNGGCGAVSVGFHGAKAAPLR